MKSILWMMKVPESHLNNKLSNKYFTSVSRARAHSKVVINRSLKVEGFFLVIVSMSIKSFFIKKRGLYCFQRNQKERRDDGVVI